MNSPKERMEEKCPGCNHWGRGHVIDIVTKLPVCTIKLIENAELQKVSEAMQKDCEGRTSSWRVCSISYSPRKTKSSVFARLFKRNRQAKRYCPVCGKKVRPVETFCSIDCAMDFMDKEEKDGAFQDR